MSSTRLFHNLDLPLSADMHVHLRDGAMMEAVTPLIERGGVDCVFVMVSSYVSLRCKFLIVCVEGAVGVWSLTCEFATGGVWYGAWDLEKFGTSCVERSETARTFCDEYDGRRP